MRLGPARRWRRIPLLAFLLIPAYSPGAGGQGVDRSVRDAYFRAVGEHFGVPFQEVAIIGEWNLTPDEVPVVLFLAETAGVSPDALIGFRRGGRSWIEVAGQVGVDVRAFHLPLPAGEDLGLLARAYGEFQERPAAEWGGIHLEDPEVVGLVNLRVLTRQTGVPPLRILRVHEERGSFLASYPDLVRR